MMCVSPKGFIILLQPDFWQGNPNFTSKILESDKLYLPCFFLKICQSMSS